MFRTTYLGRDEAAAKRSNWNQKASLSEKRGAVEARISLAFLNMLNWTREDEMKADKRTKKAERKCKTITV